MKATTNNSKIIIAVILGALAMLLFINLFSNNMMSRTLLSSHYCPMSGGMGGTSTSYLFVIGIVILIVILALWIYNKRE